LFRSRPCERARWYLVERAIVADNGCPTINDLVTVGAPRTPAPKRGAILYRASRIRVGAIISADKKRREAEAPRHPTAPMRFARPDEAYRR
jgi:hypothetical protein